jgi:YHS domain-containing protein
MQGRIWSRVQAGCVALVVVATATGAYAQKVNTASGNVAVKGYDVVAYVTAGRPMEGSAQFVHRIGGTTYRFASAANRDAFAKEPDRYVPQFGGFCAYAVSRGYTADIDPRAWRIVGGKLYLNYDRGAQAKWEEDLSGNISKGDANWPALSRK